MKKYKIATYGCQMNVHESEKIAGMLRNIDYIEAQENENYDLIIFNTCCIRDTAEKKITGHIGQIKSVKRKNPSLIVCVVGCMTQQDGMAEKLKEKYPFIDIILGTNNIDMLPDAIINLSNNHTKYVHIDSNPNPPITEFEGAYRTSGTNAWVNIMYGCNNFCTYCIVPYVRGRERSRNPQNIINEFKMLIEKGYKEITLLGQNVNSYGNDFDNEIDFAYLLEELAKIEGNHRIRFMTSHPKDLNEKVVEIIAKYDTVSNYIHLPIQSGSNKILKAMNRRYTREQYLETINMIKNKIPDCGITTDIMVGFPGETEEDFADTVDILERVKYSSAFTYIYSQRKGTPAGEMEQIPYSVKSERIQRLIKVQNNITKAISRSYEGKIFKVLCEGVKDSENVCGRTDCGRLVTFRGNAEMIGNYYNVKINKSRSASLFGDITEG